MPLRYMRARVKIKHGELIFSSGPAKRAFYERNEGKDAIIDIDDAPTANSRRYFEGAIVPAVYYQHPNSGWVDFGDAREALKLEFLPDYTRSLKGEKVRIAKSTAELSKEGFFRLLEVITRWLIEQGLECPDPEDFKAWRDSAPSAGEIYPPLGRMKQNYDKIRQQDNFDKPWLKRPKIAQ